MSGWCNCFLIGSNSMNTSQETERFQNGLDGLENRNSRSLENKSSGGHIQSSKGIRASVQRRVLTIKIIVSFYFILRSKFNKCSTVFF